MNDNKPRQYYKTSKKYRDHMERMAMWEAFAADPMLKHWLAVTGASGVAALLALFNKDDVPADTTPANKVINWYERVLGVGSPLLSAAGVFDFNKDGEGGFAGNWLGFATGSYIAWNMSVVLLYAYSGGGNSAEKGKLPIIGAMI